MAAIAPSAADVVKSAGGWLFDQVLAGWDVTVLTSDQADRRSLRILGVRDHELDYALAFPAPGPCLAAIAVPVRMYRADERVRRMVLTAAEAGRTEIRLWGDGEEVPADFDGGGPVAHRLSAAARAFKAQALTAAAIQAEGPADTEVFRRGAIRRAGLAGAR
jgi:hypothetical protein